MPASSESPETSYDLAHDLRDWRCEKLPPDVRLIVKEAVPDLAPEIEPVSYKQLKLPTNTPL